MTASTPRGRRPSSMTDADGQGPAWGSVDLDRSFRRAVGPAFGEDAGDGLGRDGVAVAAGHEGSACVLRKRTPAAFVAEHQPEGRESRDRRRRVDSALDSPTAVVAASVTSSK
jgi:hypothetical protein